MRLLIKIEGERGTGKSFMAAKLAQVYPDATVIDSHRFGDSPTDREIGPRRFVSLPLMVGNELCGRQSFIVTSDCLDHPDVRHFVLSQPYDQIIAITMGTPAAVNAR